MSKTGKAKLFKKLKIELKTDKEIEKMRIAGMAVAKALEQLEQVIVPDITTKDIDVWVSNYINSLNMSPSFLGIHGRKFPFPSSACVSINDEIVHGIPDVSRRLRDGDIVSVDIGIQHEGYHGDSARTYPVGAISKQASYLLQVTRVALDNAIEQALAGKRLGDISYAVQKTAENAGFSVVKDYTGHGIGRLLHEDPVIPNFGKPDTGIKLLPGMVLAIEPMLNMGNYAVKTLDDGWTVVTKDGSLSAHFEHTVVITEKGNEVLTRC